MKKLSIAALSAILFGCTSAQSTPPVVEPPPAPVVAAPPAPKKDFTSADMRRTVNTAVFNMLKSGTLDSVDGDKYVVAVGRIVNTTGKDDFDAAQTGVKRIFASESAAKRAAEEGCFLSSANSINWGRLVPQIVYYVHACVRLRAEGELAEGEKLDIAVPTGNFGNILAA